MRYVRGWLKMTGKQQAAATSWKTTRELSLTKRELSVLLLDFLGGGAFINV